MTQNTSLPAQKHLWSVKKHYDARLPEDVRLLPLPTGLSAQTAQLWLLENIIEPEQALEDDCRYDSPLGAVLWRKAFWKRVISLIEAEIAAGTDDEVRFRLLKAVFVPLIADTGTA